MYSSCTLRVITRSILWDRCGHVITAATLNSSIRRTRFSTPSLFGWRATGLKRQQDSLTEDGRNGMQHVLLPVYFVLGRGHSYLPAPYVASLIL